MLFAENLRALSTALPKPVVKALKKYKPRNAQITGKLEDGSINLTVDGRRQYSPDALTAAADTVNAYTQAPSRVSFPILNPNTPGIRDLAHGRFADRLISALGDPELLRNPKPGGAYMVSCGLGLGIHLPMLLESFDFRNLIVVAESPDALWCSMHVVPWRGIVLALKKRGGALTIGLLENPNVNATQIVNTLRGQHFSIVDGSYIFVDPSLPQMQQVEKKIQDNLSLLYGTIGFFEDEVLMLKNAVLNERSYHHRLLKPVSKTETNLPPAVAVGSGPSLDQNIEYLKRIRDKIVIFGSGTGTSVLLQNGIQPDFHCEIENHPEYAQLVDDDIKSGNEDFGDIPFLAPFIVDPRLSANFKEIIFYHRELLVPTRLWANLREVLWHTTPSVANLACTAAAAFGFKEVYLVGVDLGSLQPDKGHATGGYYGRHEDWTRTYPFTIPVAGNFGGMAYTNSQFLLAKSSFETFVASQSKTKVYNASNGIAIEGIEARRLDGIDTNLKRRTPGEIRQSVISSLPHCYAGTTAWKKTVDTYVTAVYEQFSILQSIVDDWRSGDIEALYDHMLPHLIGGHLDGAHTLDVSVRQTFTGTVFSMFQTGMFFEKRLADTDLAGFRAVYFDLFKETLTEMQREFDTVLTLDDASTDEARHG